MYKYTLQKRGECVQGTWDLETKYMVDSLFLVLLLRRHCPIISPSFLILKPHLLSGALG